jgi:DNA topoisomerase-2
VRLAQDYVGSNNINLLFPSGQFGTRLLGGKDASQTRYIFTRLTPEARRLFDKRDTELLPAVVDDGQKVEPEYYAPIIPTALVNGCEGIGTGFSCYVPPYNPADLKANLERVMQGKPLQKMAPWFKGFTGTLRQDGEHSWVAEGIATASGDKLTITELPPGVWTDPFKDHLDAMIEKKKITSYRNASTTQDIHFEIYGYTGTDMMKDFKLRKTFHTSNMHLFHPTQGIKRYNSPEEILTDYVEVRVRVYGERKKAMVLQLTHDAERLSEKARFIEQVCSGDIQVFRVKKVALEADLVRRKFKEVDYLLSTKTYEYTEEEVAALRQKALDARTELARVQGLSVIDMWQKDLCEL